MSVADDDITKGAIGLVLAAYGWILRVIWLKADKDHSKHCVNMDTCKNDMTGMLGYVKEVKTDIHSRMDRMEDTILKAIRGNK